MFSRLSIQIKYALIFFLALILLVAALLIGVQSLKVKQLRNEAMAVAGQVVAFRAWVAASGVVWVDQLSADFHSYLGKKPDAEGGFFFSKNPALATRELSEIVGKSSTRATFRVTSDEYRNPLNQPDAFESTAIEDFKRDKTIPYREGFDAGNYRYTQPIFVQESCLRCHGDPKDAPKDVIEKYGDQRAFGYKVGDVRGIISVRLPDVTAKDVLDNFLNPYSVSLVLLAFLINFIYTQRAIIRRLKNLAQTTERIANGELDVAIPHQANSRDEVNSVAHAVELLRKSLNVAMRHLKKS